MRTMTAGLLVPFALFTVTGCFSLGRDSPALEQYVLGASGVMEPAIPSPADAGLTIGLRRLDLAPYLATLAIVVRRGEQRIVHSDFHRWGEDPGEGINRAVARYLAATLPVRAVDVAPWPVRSQHDYLIQLHVSGFEGVAPEEPTAMQGEARMLATWEILRPGDGAVLARGNTDYRQAGWSVGDYAGLVTLLDRGLHELARDVAGCLQGLGSATARTVARAASGTWDGEC